MNRGVVNQCAPSARRQTAHPGSDLPDRSGFGSCPRTALIRGKDDSGQCRLNRRTLDVYRFLRRELGSTYLQFIPIVEIKGFETTAPQTWDPARLPIVGSPQARPDHPDSVVTPWSVDPEEYGYFLSKVWDEWLARDVGKVLVNFCETLVVQHMGMPAQVKFAYAKSEQLPGYCRRCEFLKDCWGECPKNRLLRTAEGEPGRSTISARDSSGSSPTQCPRRRRWRPNCARRRRHHSGGFEARSSCCARLARCRVGSSCLYFRVDIKPDPERAGHGWALSFTTLDAGRVGVIFRGM